jgi:hypothetical protein
LAVVVAGCVLGHAACVAEPERPLAEVWGCLSAAEATSDEPVLLRLLLLDETTEAPVGGALVRLCLRSDIDCVTPVWNSVSDGRGIVVLGMADEYLEITAAGYRKTLAMGPGSLEVTAGRKTPIDVHFDLYPDAAFAALAEASEVVRDEGLADVEVLVRDCAYESAGGVIIDMDEMGPETTRRYLVNDLPSAEARETDVDSGSAVFFNAPPGLRSVSATIVASQLAVRGEGDVLAVIARPGWLTQVAVVPRSVSINEVEGD